jgi:hypothetical protein
VVDGETRIDRLEQWRLTIDNRLWGGGNVAYERALEGRVSAMEHAMAAAHSLEKATRNINRAAGARWSRLTQVIVVVCAVVTAAAAVISALAILL